MIGAPQQASHCFSCTTFNSAGSLPFKDERGASLMVSNKISSPERSILASKSAEKDVPEEWQSSQKADMDSSQRKSPLKRHKMAYGHSSSQFISIPESKRLPSSSWGLENEVSLVTSIDFNVRKY